MPLQTAAWNGRIGGVAADLVIGSVSASGSVSLSLNGVAVAGFWDEDGQKLTFVFSAPQQKGMQIYTGYLFTDPTNLVGVSGTIVFTLVGIVDNFGTQSPQPGPTPTAKASSFGWYFQTGVD